MNRLIIPMYALVAAAVSGGFAAETPADEVEGPFVRVMMNEDGSRTVFRKSPDNRTLTKKTYSANGVVRLVTVYRLDSFANPRSCKIYDGQKQELFKVRYGYDKNFGRLVEEQMFDSRVRNIDPNTGNEMPVRRFLYMYDAQGNRSKPISIVLKPGQIAKDVYEPKPSALTENPFDRPPAPANPNAKPVGGKR